MREDYWPVWYRISLSVVCLLGGIVALLLGRLYLAGFSFLAAVLGLAVAWYLQQRKDSAGNQGG